IPLPNSSSTLPSTAAATSKAEELVDNTADDDNDCVICMAAKKDYTLVPCGHRGFCFDCATRMQQEYRLCPICRKGVDSILKIHDV
ncbi:unnamed protein product, partial [Rotaria sp. Silwood2]